MADGTKKRIEDIKVGDKAIATDPQTGEQVDKTVDHVAGLGTRASTPGC